MTSDRDASIVGNIIDMRIKPYVDILERHDLLDVEISLLSIYGIPSDIKKHHKYQYFIMFGKNHYIDNADFHVGFDLAVLVGFDHQNSIIIVRVVFEHINDKSPIDTIMLYADDFEKFVVSKLVPMYKRKLLQNI